MGKASLLTSILGFILPLLLIILVHQLPMPHDRMVMCQRVFLGLFLLSEVTAFVMGLVARRTTTAKIGATLAALLILAVATTLFVHLHVR